MSNQDGIEEAAGQSPARPTCLVLMPMLPGFEGIRARVARAVSGAGLAMIRLEEEIADSAWHLWLLDAVEGADVALVDLSGHNPFVMYEVGTAHQRRLPTAFIVRASDRRIPATTRGASCLAYGEADPRFDDALVDRLRSLRSAVSAGLDLRREPVADDALYVRALAAAGRLGREADTRFALVDEGEFRARLAIARRRGMPAPLLEGSNDLLALVLEHSDRVEVMAAIAGSELAPRALLAAE